MAEALSEVESKGSRKPTALDEVPHRLDGVRVLVLLGGGRLFGQERGNIEVFRNMAALGLKARFITRNPKEPSEVQLELSRLGLEWTTAPFGYHWGKYIFGRYFYYLFLNLYGVGATSLRLWREVRAWKPTHLYVMNWNYFTYGAPALLALRLPLIYRSGDVPPTHTVFHQWLCRLLFRRVSRMVCISNFIKGRCSAAGMAPTRMTVIYNYPPERRQSAPPETPPVSDGAVVILYIGQISEQKGVPVLVEAVERLIGQGQNVCLWLLGDPSWGSSLLDSLKQQVASKGLQERIVFLGYVENVFPFLRRSDLHVCPSVSSEGLSHVVGEAKLCGKPSVVFPTGGLPELVEHGIDGYICKDCTVESLIEGLRYFLADEAERRNAGLAASRSLEEKFGLDRFRRQWAEVFLSTLAKDPPSR